MGENGVQGVQHLQPWGSDSTAPVTKTSALKVVSSARLDVACVKVEERP